MPRSVRACVSQVNNILVDDFTFQSRGNRTLVIAFAGMAGILRTFSIVKQKMGIETRPFEFVHSLQDKECDVLFLRDRHRAYYHSGVKGVGGSVDEVANFLNDFIDQRGYNLVATLGHSMGGYASILFASKINADICVAISAPTFLDPENRRVHDDKRYAEEKIKLWESKPESIRYFDLKSYFLSKEHLEIKNHCEYFLFYGERDRLDKIHANRMAGLDRPVNVFEVSGGDHNTARKMRESGFLSRLYDSILALDGGQDVDSLLRMMGSENSVRQPFSPHKSP